MRPSEDVLSSFYDLADLDANKRYSAVIKIVEAVCYNSFLFNFLLKLTVNSNACECKSNGDYCMERLIGGLASPRAAARLGYTTALVHTLTKFSDDWPAKSLFDLAESKLDISKVEGSSPAALGRHLLYSAMITSQCYAEVCVELFERELAIFDKYHYFGMAIAQSLAGLSRQLDEKTFMKKIVPLIKGRVCVECDSFMSEWLLFILLIRDKFKDALKRNVKFFRSDGKLSIEKQNYEDFVNILKRTEGCAENTLARELLSAARDSGIFDAVYTDIVEKWLMNGDMYKVFQRCFGFVDELLSEDSTLKPNEFVVIFSSNLIAQFRSVRKSREYRFYAQIVEAILEKLAKSLSSGQWKRSELISLLNTIDSTDGGNFDECFHAKSRITEKLITQLDAKGVEIVVDKALNHGGWYVRRVAGVFGQWPDDIKEKVLVKLAKHETRSEEVHTTLCKCIDSMFSINVRAGRSVKMAFSEEDEKLLRDLLSAICVKKIKMPKSENRFTIQLPDDEMMVGEKDEQEDEDDEGMQVDDEDQQNGIVSERVYFRYQIATLDDGQNEEHDDTEDSEAKESGSDTDISEDEDIEDEQEEVDEEFKNKLKAALGDAAVPSDVDEDDDDKVSIDSTVSDETMFRLDEGLAAVFRERMKGARKASASTLEQIHQFRMKCFDLLLIVVSHENSAQFTSQFIIPLLQITRESLQRKNGDVMFNRASNLIEIIVKYKKGDVSEKKGAKLLKKMVAVSSQIVNPVLKIKLLFLESIS
ncbi:unnamed protein product [Anisakis simplex]|uniref:DUF2428 domain-containing protein n=1 Tax=Anisakis simplex TaxID=6269 RepID=A0A0M3K8D9_ANISI|nr:unnamed protein product [Anisakis simplex]